MNTLTSLLNILAEVGYNEHWTKGMALLAAGIAILTAAATSIGQGIIGAKAMSAISRQPEATGKIRSTMMIAQVMVETSAIYALIIAIILTTKA